jgi:hypothetical protein
MVVGATFSDDTGQREERLVREYAIVFFVVVCELAISLRLLAPPKRFNECSEIHPRGIRRASITEIG